MFVLCRCFCCGWRLPRVLSRCAHRLTVPAAALRCAVQARSRHSHSVRPHPPSASFTMSDPLRRDLSIIARSHMNSKCADCRAKAPTFASHTLGVFLCVACAQTHRELLEDTSHTRSLMYDAWTPESVALMSEVGNLKFNASWEAHLTMSQRIGAGATEENRRAFIRRKYIDREWFVEPPAPGEAPVTPAAPGPWVTPPDALPMSRAERRRVKMNKVAAQCELEAAEEELRRLDPRARAEPPFSNAGARAAAEALAASAVLPQRLPPLHPLLSFVLTTSAVPSNPSLELVERVLQSLESCLGLDRHRPQGCDEAAAAATEAGVDSVAATAVSAPASAAAASSLPSSTAPAAASSASVSSLPAFPHSGQLKCQLLLVMDGYALDGKLRAGATPKFKNGLLDAQSIEAYEVYKTRLREHIAAQPYPHLHLIGLELPFRQGFAGAVHQSLHFVSTPYIMLLQHDWAFIKELPHSVWQLIECMERNKPKPEETAAQAKQNEEEQDLMEEAAETKGEYDTSPRAPTMAQGTAESEASASPEPDASVAVPAPSPSSSPPAASPSPSPSPSASPAPASPAILPINYIGFMASTTTSYLAKDFHDVARHVGKGVHRMHIYPTAPEETAEQYASLSKIEAQNISMECSENSPIPLCPIYFCQ